MNILLINYMETTFPGGINKVVRELGINLSSKHNITVIQPNNFNLPKVEIYEGFKIIRIKSITRKLNFLYDFSPEIYFYLKKNFHKLNPDIVHIHGYHRIFPSEVMYIIRKKYPHIPIIFSPHFGIFSNDTLAGKYLFGFYNHVLGKKIMEYPDKLIAASEFEAENLKKIFDLSEKEIEIIPHGVNKIDLKPKKKADEIKLLYVGYLLELKGVQYIIKSIETLKKRKCKVTLTIIGEGHYKNQLLKLAKQLGVLENIIWQNFIPPSEHERLLNAYKESDILLLLSKSENYGAVVPEALAMGTPVIVTNRTALKEFLAEPGCSGVEYPPDPDRVADLILDNHEQVGPLSNKIISWDEVALNYQKTYYKVLGK